jgi:hypothetical protein
MMIIVRNRRLRLLILLLAIWLPPILVGARELTENQELEVAACALHGGGGWVGKNFYDKGKVRFSSVSEPDLDTSDEKDPRNIYVAFWNAKRSAGNLLVFHFFKSHQGKDLFILNNEAHIVNNHGHLEIEDENGGIYTHRKLQGLLPRLRRRRVRIVIAAHAKAGSSICETPLDFNRDKEKE